MEPYFIDLGQAMPEDLAVEIGELTVMFGRLEYLVLLAIKRLRKDPWEEIYKLYTGTSLGTKLNGGRKVCDGAGHSRQDKQSQIGLIELAEGNEELLTLCDEIQNITTERNQIMHGLWTTVDDALLIHKNNVYPKTIQELLVLQEKIAEVYVSLNKLIGATGIYASRASGPPLQVMYEKGAIFGDESIVTLIERLDEQN